MGKDWKIDKIAGGQTYGIGWIEGAVFCKWGFVEWEEQGGSDRLIDEVFGEVDKHQREYAVAVLVSR